MFKQNCKCPHHWVNLVLMILVWVSGILFFWTSLRQVAVWGFESLYYAWAAVVLTLMNLASKHCGCCGRMMSKNGASEGAKMVCSHDMGCKCNDCPRCA